MRRHTICALVTGVHTSALPIFICDELGDKIDSTNTRAVFEYLKSLRLQPVVAAPDDALSKIDESVDGYIEMYRDEDFLSIKHVRLGPAAVDLLESDKWDKQIGIASCRERVSTYGSITGVAGSL